MSWTDVVGWTPHVDTHINPFVFEVTPSALFTDRLDLRRLFLLELPRAAAALHLCSRSFKRVCRDAGLMCWPRRTLVSLLRLERGLRVLSGPQHVHYNDVLFVRRVIHCVYADPTYELPERIKQLREHVFRRQSRARKQGEAGSVCKSARGYRAGRLAPVHTRVGAGQP